ncbi:MAG: hypothetical protein FJ278_05385, partial [Planctomycetes bacterium]|nr:hypothetical protein [Planctomycetota bacterium]
MRLRTRCAISLLWLGLLIRAGAADVAFKAHFDRDEAVLGKTTGLTVEATWLEAENGQWQVLGITMPKLKGLELVKSDSKGESFPEGQTVRHRRVFRYELKATEAGDAETGPIEIAYAPSAAPKPPPEAESAAPDKRTHTIESKTVRVVARKGLGSVEWAVIAVAAFVFLVIAVIWAVDRSRKRRAEREAASKPPPGKLEAETLAKMDEVKPLRIEGEVKTYCARLLGLLDGYLTARYGSSGLGPDLSATVSQIREACESIR